MPVGVALQARGHPSRLWLCGDEKKFEPFDLPPGPMSSMARFGLGCALAIAGVAAGCSDSAGTVLLTRTYDAGDAGSPNETTDGGEHEGNGGDAETPSPPYCPTGLYVGGCVRAPD